MPAAHAKVLTLSPNALLSRLIHKRCPPGRPSLCEVNEELERIAV